jgi:hypothetical protein
MPFSRPELFHTGYLHSKDRDSHVSYQTPPPSTIRSRLWESKLHSLTMMV